MASTLRPGFALANAFKQVPKQSARTFQLQARAFHKQTPFKSQPTNFFSKPAKASTTASSSTLLAKSRDAFRRTYADGPTISNPAGSGNLTQRLLYGAGIFGGTMLAINLVFNRETREDGGMPAFEKAYLNETFLHTGLGIGIIGMAARALHQSGWSIRLMAANPWAVMGGGLVLSIGSMYGCMSVQPEK